MDRFARVYIEITNMCNLSCSFCAGNKREPRLMSTSEFSNILQQISPYTRHIYLHVLGEPLLHPQLKELLDIAYKAKIKVNITTNGTLLSRQQKMLLQANSLRKVSISLHSLEPNSMYLADDYLRDVAVFVKAAADKGVLCDLRLWNLGVKEIDNEDIFEKMCKLFNFDNIIKQEARQKLCDGGNVTLAQNIFLGAAARFEWPNINAQRTKEGVFCFGLRNHAAILCDGTVVPCCLDSNGDIALGNIFETPFATIIQGERAQKLYDGFSARRPSEELCQRCQYATRF